MAARRDDKGAGRDFRGWWICILFLLVVVIIAGMYIYIKLYQIPYLKYKVCPEGIQPSNMKNRDIYRRRYKIQETLYTG